MAGEKEKVATAWLSNQAVIYVILGIAGLGALIWLISYLRVWFSQLVDKVLGWFQSFIPKPSSQISADRTVTDDLTGLVYANQGDRALSDLVSGYSDTNVLPADIASRLQQYQAAGWIDGNGNLTAAGKVAASQGLMAEPGS